MNEDKKVSSFTYDLLERESQSEEQKERRAIRRKTLEEKAKIKDDPAKEKRARVRKRTMLVLFLVVALFGTFTVRSVQRMVSLTRERAMVQAQLEELEKRLSQLENELLMVKTDEYVDQQARSQLHMIKP
ncbi:MAG: septum formation initiator family protein, partial [Firmicutes bacterium]|nr:septum formation initiator family protein [Bacillota bacterium]